MRKKTKSFIDYQTLDQNNKLIINLRDLSHMLRFLFEGKGSQKRILIILLENNHMTQRELTERLGIQPGSASEVIRKLENMKMIQRLPNPNDHRTTDIFLTSQGETQAKKALEQRQRRHQEMFTCLTDSEKETLLALLEKLNHDWHDRYHEKHKKHHSSF